MAVGDDAKQAGYPLVPNTGDQGKVRLGAQKINETRDMVARLSFYGTPPPNNDDGKPDGTFYHQII